VVKKYQKCFEFLNIKRKMTQKYVKVVAWLVSGMMASQTGDLCTAYFCL
jgi:hypothetical protein